MQFPVKVGPPTVLKTPCAVVPVFEDGPLAGATKQLDRGCGGIIQRLLRSTEASAKPGRVRIVHASRGPAKRLLIVGCGKRAQFGLKQLATALAAAAQGLIDASIRDAVSYLGYDEGATLGAYLRARTTVQVTRSTVYRFDELKSKVEPRPALNRLAIAVADRTEVKEARRGVGDGEAIADGMDLARTLGNRPANICTPTHLAQVAADIARTHANMKLRVLEERDMKRLGMGALLAVTSGAGEPAKLIVLEYRGAPKRAAPIAICGKGVTFDTGGISLKPPPKMDEMKFDMCGAAGVLGTMLSLGKLRAPCNVVAVIPACENMPGSKATRPGDIATSMSGQTIEIINTDAEGRLILSDALTYAQRTFKPRLVLDVATLTGACVVALGPVYTGVFTPHDDLAEKLIAASQRALDPAWRLPVDDEYGETLRSNFADFANSGSRDGGASIAAQFLSRFVSGTKWAHLDIAGVAWRASANKGATGRPVPLLVDFLLNGAA
ncbi:MAG TPA: leucyl aminopeptidase [Gammaproteobacteria bacterium]|jgi:leucyl aminopeptidase